jgi:asparagine synthase (glutamine-hydrolysing)
MEGLRRQVEHFHDRGVAVHMTGDGGDEIFYRGGMIPTAVDVAFDKGLRSSVLRTALDDARVRRQSLRNVLSAVWYYGIRKLEPPTWAEVQDDASNALMPKELVRQAQQDQTFLHPMFRDARPELAPGAAEHAFLISFGLGRDYLPPLVPHQQQQLTPLISLPLLELSLRIPIYLLHKGGVDRVMARKAFENRLPRQIVTRKSKVFGDTRYEAIILNNLSFVREALLEGYLVKEGLLARDRVEQVLGGNPTNIRSRVMEILNYLGIEMWVRSLQPRYRQAA